MWVKKFDLQITVTYIQFSHYVNPPNCIVDTADIWKTLDFFLYLFLQSMICQNQIDKTLYPGANLELTWGQYTDFRDT